MGLDLGASPQAERWLQLMEQKDHFAWHVLTSGKLSREQLRTHYQQEYAAYVRDFPVLLARVLGQGPPDEVRRALAENIYEEQTGGLSREGPHPVLFLELMEGLGFHRRDFDDVTMLPGTAGYRAFLDLSTRDPDWRVGYAVMCVFVEGSAKERSALGLAPTPAGAPTTVDEAIAAHPLIKQYGVDPRHARLTRAHFAVEGGHRADAWNLLLPAVRSEGDAEKIERALRTALGLWHLYRDGVAAAMGVTAADARRE